MAAFGAIISKCIGLPPHLSVVVAPILVRSYLQSAFPASLYTDYTICSSVCCIGFFTPCKQVLAAAFARCKEPQRRAISIEVGMQNPLGVVLATSHFTSPLFALAPAMSAVIMNITGSSQGFLWRYLDPSHGKKEPESYTK